MSALDERSGQGTMQPPSLLDSSRDQVFPRQLIVDLLVFAGSMVGLGLLYGLAQSAASGSLTQILPYLGVSLLFAMGFLIIGSVVTYIGRRAILRDRMRTRAIRESLIDVHLAALDASNINPHRAEPARHG